MKRKNVAIIGAGLAGLSTGFFLTQLGCKVFFFDKNKVGEGTSGIAAGLLHPYVGEMCRRSLFATEALQKAKELLDLIPGSILEEGIIRIAQTENQKESFMQHIDTFRDVQYLHDNTFLLQTGIVVDTKLYLQGLLDICLVKGATFIQQEIVDLEGLSHFDEVVVAAGYMAPLFFPEIQSKVSLVKGQLIDVVAEKAIKTTIARGYFAKSRNKGVYHWGATYERGFSDVLPCKQNALALLKKEHFPLGSDVECIAVKAGVRLVRRELYLPFASLMRDHVWWLGALGSRGLLYHALWGSDLAEAIIQSDERLLKERCQWKK